MLKIHELSKRYTTGELALDKVSFTLEAGEVVALIGPSGAGKSTLIRCVNRLVEPTSGTIHLQDLNLTSLGTSKLRKVRRRIGMIFQAHALVDRLTVMENVLSGQLGYVGFWPSLTRKFPRDTIRQALNILKDVGLADHIDKRADQLSGGQRQRVGIARAFLQNPDLLLVDEPTASLDPKTSIQIMRLIMELATSRDLTAIVNIHDVALAKRFIQRTIGLKEGSVVFDGPSNTLSAAELTAIYGEEDWAESEITAEDTHKVPDEPTRDTPQAVR